jgi:hypothetical protein
MGGPGANVLLRQTLTKQQENELEIWLRSITHHLEKKEWGYESGDTMNHHSAIK